MKLTQDQIQQLYKFTRAHYVEHYDLQTELVDHLANGIETLQNSNPNLTFQEALNKEFKKFGIFGFMDVLDERKKAMGKRYFKIIATYFKEYFRLPKIILTLALIFLLTGLLTLVPNIYQSYWIMGILFVGVSPMLISTLTRPKELKKKERKWLLEEMLLSHAGITQLFILPIHFWNLEFSFTSLLGLFIISFIIVFYLLAAYIITFVIPSKAEKLLEETYPEYKLT